MSLSRRKSHKSFKLNVRYAGQYTQTLSPRSTSSLNERVSDYIISLPSPQKEICQALRELILGNFPRITEEFKWNYPAYYYGGKRICSTGGFKKHANLELDYGAHLKDVKGRVVGAGKNIRHIKIKALDEVDTDYFIDLLKQRIKVVEEKGS